MKKTLKEVTSINKGICGDIFVSCLSTVQLNVFNLRLYYCVDNMFCLYFLNVKISNCSVIVLSFTRKESALLSCILWLYKYASGGVIKSTRFAKGRADRLGFRQRPASGGGQTRWHTWSG